MADDTTTKDAPETAQAQQAEATNEATTPEPQAAEAGPPETAEEAETPQAQGEAPDDAEASDTEEADDGATGAEDADAQAAAQEDAEAADQAVKAEQEEPTDDEEPEAEPKREHEATIEALLKAGVHFGHLTSRWHPRMDAFIFMERNNIHIIDLMQSQVLLDEAADAARRFAKRGKEILFVGTKKQAQEIVRRHAEESEQPFMVERWLGGTMTNFQTIQRSIHRMEDIERMEKDGTLDKLKKKERLVRLREHDKLETILGGIRDLARLPGAIYVVDIRRENIAVSEANKLGIPVIAMVDTNCDPERVDHAVPANDDALSSIELVTSVIARAIQEGKAAREREQQAKKQQANA